MLGIRLKNIDDMNSLNYMNSIYDKDVNDISECNLLYDLINNPTLPKNINPHYYPVLYGCMNTCRGGYNMKKSNIVRQWM